MNTTSDELSEQARRVQIAEASLRSERLRRDALIVARIAGGDTEREAARKAGVARSYAHRCVMLARANGSAPSP